MDGIIRWRTSTRTQGQGQCVEVGFGADEIGIRDTKNRRAAHLTVCRGKWREFVAGIKSDRVRGHDELPSGARSPR